MNTLNNFLNRFFRTQKISYQAPFLHEPYDFDIYAESYVLWKDGNAHLALSQLIINSYKSYVLKEEYHKGIHFMRTPQVAGVALTSKEFGFTKQDYIYLSTYIKERLLEKIYIQQLSEIKSKNENGNIILAIKCYLKPSRKNVRDGKNEQLYGNVSMEIRSVNEKLSQFKISCSYYQDQYFNEPLDFNLFLQEIINHE